MPITINGTGTVTGISAGGLPDDCIVTADIAAGAVTPAKLSGGQSGSAPVYGCRAWVNFDGTRNEADTGASTNGANVKIRASGNVTSVLKNAVGDYTVNFTTAMVDANYSVTLGWTTSSPATSYDGTCAVYSSAGVTASSVRLFSAQGQTVSAGEDAEYFAIAIFR